MSDCDHVWGLDGIHWRCLTCAVQWESPEIASLRTRAEQAEAEAARLRGEYARGLREAADVARAHGGISAYYAITKLAAEVEP